MMRGADVVSTDILSGAQVVAGHTGLQRRVTWIHIVELPTPGPWIGRNQLLLTTGYSWPNDDAYVRNLIRDLDSRGVAGIGLAVPSYHDEFSSVAKSEADRVGLPLLEIPWDIPFSSITEALNRAIIGEQERHREQANAVHRLLTRSSIEADSIGQLVSEFSRLIRRTVVLEDTNGNLIAFQVRQDLSGNAASTAIAAPDELRYSLRELVPSGYWTSIQSSQSASRAPWNTAHKSGSLVASPVWIKRELEGFLWIPDDEDPLSELEVQAAEHAATVLALHIARDHAVVNVEQRLRYTLIESLLEGQFHCDKLGLERAALMGFDPNAQYRVIIFVLDAPIPLNQASYMRRERFIGRLVQRLATLGNAPLISPSLNEISVVAPSETSVDQLSERLLDDDVSALAGRSHHGVEGVRRSYLEARYCLTWSHPNKIISYADVLLPRLLEGDQDARRHFTEEMMQPLRDALHSDVYIETLRNLAACGFNQRQASTVMCVHPKTMQYRVGRIQEIIQLDFSQPQERFKVQMLCQLLDIRKGSRFRCFANCWTLMIKD